MSRHHGHPLGPRAGLPPEAATPLMIVGLIWGSAALVGLVEALTGAFIGGQYVLMTQFGFIILVLLVRPRGIAGLLDHTRE